MVAFPWFSCFFVSYDNIHVISSFYEPVRLGIAVDALMDLALENKQSWNIV